MPEHWQGRRFLVVFPRDEPRFYRLVRVAEIDADDFKSDWERGWARLRGEDICRYRGISVWETLDQAVRYGSEANERIRQKGGAPYTHIAEVSLSWELGMACARTGGTDGHHTIWGNHDDLASRVIAVFPFDGRTSV